MRHRAALEKAVFARVSELFGLDWTVTLYDLTNISRRYPPPRHLPHAHAPPPHPAPAACPPRGR